MAKIPDKPEDIYDEFVRDFTGLFGADLESVFVYGSAARGEYVPKKSDINCALILTNNGIERFHIALELIKKWSRRNVAIPLFLNEEYIMNSLDTFPIEFLNISSHYRVLFGKDVFASIDLNRDHIRLQLEREMKGNLLNLRQAYFQAAGRPRSASLLIADSFGSFLSLFPAILLLKNEAISGSTVENINRISVLFKLDVNVLQRLYRAKQGREKISKKDSFELLRSYIAQIRSLALQTDSL
ncbi:hypothetical protein ACFL6I_22560 [candidate division KSB1 bacterium]